jgi:3-oxoadipate enol-lactonase
MKARINSVDIAYDDHGAGTPILFLHAFPLNKNMWAGQISALLGQGNGTPCPYRLVALDWRGFGESSLANDISTMELLADDVAGLMDTLGMQRAIICGLSMGGYITFSFLRKYPQRVQGLILADTRPGADPAEGKANRENIARLALSQGPGAVADILIPNVLSSYTRQHHPLVEESVRQMINAASPQGIAAASRGMALRPDSSDLLASISCPTLVVVGEQDAFAPPAVAREYAAGIRESQLVIIPNAGHLSPLEQPQAFLAAVQKFLCFNPEQV